jgi:hypothetical protein
LYFGEQRAKANSTFFIGRSAAYYKKQVNPSGITSGMDRAPVMDMEFRRDEEGGSGGVFVK